ncbi:hypothetical protein PAL_GLEAN10024789 [Pteropus alecto]|uniref:Uncharacterized protein n=1 Tax=Pteropus alecto TaxID=9402 RepID=L5JYB5_PTEAL|nr:hypothetical protein PAL_GLEAN10024789 [Pteropus alecto]
MPRRLRLFRWLLSARRATPSATVPAPAAPAIPAPTPAAARPPPEHGLCWPRYPRARRHRAPPLPGSRLGPSARPAAPVGLPGADHGAPRGPGVRLPLPAWIASQPPLGPSPRSRSLAFRRSRQLSFCSRPALAGSAALRSCAAPLETLHLNLGRGVVRGCRGGQGRRNRPRVQRCAPWVATVLGAQPT